MLASSSRGLRDWMLPRLFSLPRLSSLCYNPLSLLFALVSAPRTSFTGICFCSFASRSSTPAYTDYIRFSTIDALNLDRFFARPGHGDKKAKKNPED
jgi:hypothetical protein